jgi:hypothetical protein
MRLFFDSAVLLVLLAVSADTVWSYQVVDNDRIALPPTLEEVTSPSGQYVFAISTPDNWKTTKSVGELFEIVDGARRLLWSRSLPHGFRPRYALMGNQGNVLLLDEWINIKSDYAVMVIDRDNQLIAQHDFDAVQTVLGVPGSEIVTVARYGFWIGAPPLVDPSGKSAEVVAGGKTLAIRLADGHISLSKTTLLP